MANTSLGRIIGTLRSAGPPDAELLDRYRAGDDEAFAAIVRRHGRAVLTACRRVLADPAAIDDAFQATFLLLVRKIDAIEAPTLGSWLYAVAHRLAVRARADAQRRAARERSAATRRSELPWPDPASEEAVAALHEELDRLPERYRRVMLCHLSGQSRQQAAASLGWPEGAVKGCLERGRRLLADRLARRGITPSAGLFAAAPGTPPSPPLVRRTAEAALSQGGGSMAGTVKKSLVVVALVLTGLTGLAHLGFEPSSTAPAEPAASTTELDGEWHVVEGYQDGRKQPSFKVRAEGVRVVFQGGRMAMRVRDGSSALPDGTRFRHDPSQSPKRITLAVPARDGPEVLTVPGTYSLEQGRLRLRLNFKEEGGPMMLELARRPLAEPADKLAAVLQEWSQSKGEPEPLAERCLAVAASDPEGPTGLAALCWAACRSTGQAGREAFSRLEGRVPTAGLEDLFGALDDLGGVQAKERNDNLGRLVLERVKRDLDHPRAPRLLCWVCVLARWAEYDEAPDYFAKAADLLVSRFADRADVNHFCESLGTIGGGAPPWAAPYERHLRAVLKESKHRHMRAFATFALAQVVQLGGEARQAEAAALYEQYLKEFDGSDPVWGSERSMRVRAGHELEVIRTLGLGMPAPEIDGVDLDGQPMRLKDHRGKVVLLSFWGTWCPACLELVPHEKEVVERLRGKPFALVGVNGDPLDTDLRPAVKKHRITWRSFKNEQPGKPRIDRVYKVRAWPTLVLIDHEGVMRARWSGTPSRKALNHEIDRLVRAAEAAR